MSVRSSRRPSAAALAAGLTRVLNGRASASAPVTIVERRPTNEGTFPKELVTCRLADGGTRTLFCKYGTDEGNAAYGHRGGVVYETRVYRALLRNSGFSTPGYVGAYEDPGTGMTWLVLEPLEGCLRLHHTADPDAAMARAAGWIGRFHAAHAGRRPKAGLNVYDARYYRGWGRRTLEFARPLRDRFPWLADLCAAFRDLIDHLLLVPQTVIHGEYYPKNVLVRGEDIHPVDWESAALAAGEIDLASLTEGWPLKTALSCERAYRQARWPEGPPEGAERTSIAAKLYLHFRWLGDRPDWTTQNEFWRFKQLRTMGRRLGVI